VTQNRRTCKKTVCFDLRNVQQQKTDIQAIMDQKTESQIRLQNELYFSRRVLWDNPRATTDSCCPCLLNSCVNKSVLTRAENNFTSALAELYIRGGADVYKRLFTEMVSMDEEQKQAKTIIKEVPIMKLLDIYRETPQSVFDIMKPNQRKFYASCAAMNAFRMQERLRSQGPNFIEAMDVMLAKDHRAHVALQAVRNSGKFSENFIVRAELAAGVLGGNYNLQVLGIIRQLMYMFTESEDPFQLISKYRTDLECILGCSPAIDDEGNEVQAMSNEKTAALFTLYDKFLALDPINHRPFHAVKKVTRLPFLKAIIAFGHITVPILGIDLCRTTTCRGSRNEKKDFQYVMRITCFTEKCEKPTTPVLPPWNQSPTQLNEGDELKIKMVGGRLILTLNSEFASSNDTRGGSRQYGYEPINANHLMPSEPTDIFTPLNKNGPACKDMTKDTADIETRLQRLDACNSTETAKEKLNAYQLKKQSQIKRSAKKKQAVYEKQIKNSETKKTSALQWKRIRSDFSVMRRLAVGKSTETLKDKVKAYLLKEQLERKRSAKKKQDACDMKSTIVNVSTKPKIKPNLLKEKRKQILRVKQLQQKIQNNADDTRKKYVRPDGIESYVQMDEKSKLVNTIPSRDEKDIKNDADNQAKRKRFLTESQDDTTKSLRNLFALPVLLRRRVGPRSLADIGD